MSPINIRPAVGATALMFLVSGLMPAFAAASNNNGNGDSPPGNSAISQYIESFPTAGGGKPSQGLHRHHRGGSGSVPRSTQRALSGGGSAGQGALAFANATGPSAGAGANTGSGHANGGSNTGGHSGTARTGSAGGSAGPGAAGLNGAASGSGNSSSSGGSSPLSSVLSAFFGSTSKGGLGPWLPALLILILLGGCAVGLRYRYRRGSS